MEHVRVESDAAEGGIVKHWCRLERGESRRERVYNSLVIVPPLPSLMS